MEFIKFTMTNSDEPIFVVKEQIVSINTIPNTNDYTLIKLNGGHEIRVAEKVEDVKKIINGKTNNFFVV